MSRRPSSLFRGSELPRLLFLVAIVLAGWPIFVIFARPQAPDAPPPPSVPVDKLTQVDADDGIEFQAILDKAPIQSRESTAYATLLERARETPPDQLASQARRDIFYTHLWERPKHYRGVPIHLVGTAKKVLAHDVAPSMSPTGRLYEVWFYSDENRAFPYVVTIEDPPKGLVIGHELNLRVTVDGYFMKLLGYHAGDQLRAAPMLVGRMQWTPALPSAPTNMSELGNLSRRNIVLIVLVLVIVYVILRLVFQVKKTTGTRRVRSTFSAPSEGLPPDEVVEWLQNLPAGNSENNEAESPIFRPIDHPRE